MPQPGLIFPSHPEVPAEAAVVARQPRFDAPGALHHVMVRGIERRALFMDDLDRQDLLERLCRILPEAEASCPAWAFMPNHVHYVIRAGKVPLSQVMRRLNTGFAVRFNLRHERVGYLFQNRFRSRLVAGDEDLRNLVRYVSLNPLRAGLVASLEHLERFRWCSYGALLGRRASLPFEDLPAGLAPFADRTSLARARLRASMRRSDGEEAGVPEEAPFPIAPRARSSVDEPPAEVHRDLVQLTTAACQRLGVSVRELQRGARSDRASRARALICHVAVSCWRLPRKMVAEAVGVSPSAVSHVLVRGAEIAREEPAIIHQFTTVPA